MINPSDKKLVAKLIGWSIVGQIALAICLFVPGTTNYWQGWAFMAVNAAVSVIFCTFLYRRDRELLARRMLRKEKFTTQKIVLFLMKKASILLYVFCAFDNRFHWSATYFVPVPWWLTIVALVAYGVCYFLFIPVMTANRFAASIIQVETGQTVAAGGPYRLVRHPMYAIAIVLWFWMPLALGSFVGFPVAALIVPILVVRLLNEEKILRRDLPGYTDYCQQTRYRLLPRVW